MTDHQSAEMFDRSLDALSDDDLNADENDLTATASWLQDSFGMAGSRHGGPSARQKAAIRRRVMSVQTAAPSSGSSGWRQEGTLGIAASPVGIRELPRSGSLRHVAVLVAAAIVILLAIAMFGTLLRLDDNERVPGAAATASMMPFAPASVLASPTAVSSSMKRATYKPTSECGGSSTFQGRSRPVRSSSGLRVSASGSPVSIGQPD